MYNGGNVTWYKGDTTVLYTDTDKKTLTILHFQCLVGHEISCITVCWDPLVEYLVTMYNSGNFTWYTGNTVLYSRTLPGNNVQHWYITS